MNRCNHKVSWQLTVGSWQFEACTPSLSTDNRQPTTGGLRSARSFFVSFLCLLLLATSAFAQTDRRSLEKKRDAIDKQIKTTDKLIGKAREKRKLGQQEVKILDRQIALRQELIGTVGSEVARLDQRGKELNGSIESLGDDLVNLKSGYANMLQQAYKNRSAYDRLSYIFASESFTQAFRRSRYLSQLAEHRQRQARMIEETQEALDQQAQELLAQKEEKQELLTAKQAERNALDRDKSERNVALSQLKKEESKLKKELDAKRAERSNLSKAIARIIEEEIRKNREANSGSFSLTPEALELSAAFEANKGKLPWPVERGVITSTFGVQPHPVLKGIKIENNGVDIATEEGSAVRALFGGKVTSIIVIPGAGKAVVLDHGAYRTVYSNLREAYVKKGDKVETKQALGAVLTSDDQSTAHLEIWKISSAGVSKVDPAMWILKGW